MTEKEKAYYELGMLNMAQHIIAATKNSGLLESRNRSYLEGVCDAWNVVYDIIDFKTDCMTIKEGANNGNRMEDHQV